MATAKTTMRNVMVDLETLGQAPGCIVLSIGAVAFDANGLGAEFYRVINIDHSKELGLHENEEILAWWNKQSPEARKVIDEASKAKTSVKVHEAIKDFNQYLLPFTHGGVKVWGNGANFDNTILAAMYTAAGLKTPWPFWNDRCYRTLKNLFKGIKPEVAREGTYHNALDDAIAQARHAVQIFEANGFK